MPFGPNLGGSTPSGSPPDDEHKNWIEKHGTVIGIVVAVAAAGITFWAVTRGSSGTGSATNTANSPLAVPTPSSGGGSAGFDPTALQAQVAADQASLTSQSGWIQWLTTKANALQAQVNTLSSQAASSAGASGSSGSNAGGAGGSGGGSGGSPPPLSKPVEESFSSVLQSTVKATQQVNTQKPGTGNAILQPLKNPPKPVLNLRTF